MPKWTFRRDVSLSVLARARYATDHHEDLGCSILGPVSRRVRHAHQWLKARCQELGPERSAREARALIRALEATARYQALCTGRKRLGRLELAEAVIFPGPRKTAPKVLHVRRGSLAYNLHVPNKGDWPALADLCASLARGLTDTERRLFSRVPTCRELLLALREADCLEVGSPRVVGPEVGFTFIGHNTTLVRDAGSAVLIDPYFRPQIDLDLPGYAPLHARDLGKIDAVCITHSHGDHFHLGSLLTLPRDTTLFVPAVERESLFSTDCAFRLQQLGFTNVQAVDWHSSRRVGALNVQALPFYGEQPTRSPGLYASLFNEGATFTIRGPKVSAAFFADAGDDCRGSMREVCSLVRRGGPVEALFCGVRGFRLKPIFLSFTTLDTFLINVPLDELTIQQSLMASASDALEYGRILGASSLVPCADGGAPWYWREGMGPHYPGYPGAPVDGASTLPENLDADPYPERVASLAEQAGPQVVLLRPGEGLAGTRRRVFEGHRWPFEPLRLSQQRQSRSRS